MVKIFSTRKLGSNKSPDFQLSLALATHTRNEHPPPFVACARWQRHVLSASTSPIPAKTLVAAAAYRFNRPSPSPGFCRAAAFRHPLPRSSYVSFISMRPPPLSFVAQALHRRVARHFLLIVYISARNGALGACVNKRIFANLSARRHRKRARNSNTERAPGIERNQLHSTISSCLLTSPTGANARAIRLRKLRFFQPVPKRQPLVVCSAAPSPMALET